MLPETESSVLASALVGWDELITAAVALTEVQRAVVRWTSIRRVAPSEARKYWSDAQTLTRRLSLMDTDIPTLREAANIPPVKLATLDAIHLVTGIAVKDEIEAFVTYDARLAEAARAAGLKVASPS